MPSRREPESLTGRPRHRNRRNAANRRYIQRRSTGGRIGRHGRKGGPRHRRQPWAGRATALALARRGARVAICSRDPAAASAATAIAKETGAETWSSAADVSKRDEVSKFVGDAASRFGGVDVLVSNAGGPPAGEFGVFEDPEWERAFDLIVMSAIRLVREVLPHMHHRGGGRILFILSSLVRGPIDHLILSNVMRPAVAGLSQSLARELAGEQIQVNAIAPGAILTDRVRELRAAAAEREGISLEDSIARAGQEIPLGGWANPRSSPPRRPSSPRRRPATSRAAFTPWMAGGCGVFRPRRKLEKKRGRGGPGTGAALLWRGFLPDRPRFFKGGDLPIQLGDKKFRCLSKRLETGRAEDVGRFHLHARPAIGHFCNENRQGGKSGQRHDTPLFGTRLAHVKLQVMHGPECRRIHQLVGLLEHPTPPGAGPLEGVRSPRSSRRGRLPGGKS